MAEWQDAFGLSHGDFGLLYMVATLGSAVCLPFVGRLVDVFPERGVVTFVIPLLAAATVLAAHAPSLLILGLALFLLRLMGQGMMSHIALTATGRWFAAQRGRAVSLVVLGHQGGEATLPLLFSTLAVAFGYRAGWIAGGFSLILVALPFCLWAFAKPRVPDPVRPSGDAAGRAVPIRRDWTRAEVMRDPVFWVLLTGALAPPFIGTIVFFHQDYLTALREWPPQYFAATLSIMAATTVGFALVNGVIVDRVGSTAVLPFFLIPLAGACFTLAVDGPRVLLVLTMVLLGISYGTSSTLFGAIWPEIYGTAHLGAIRSLIVSAVVFATAAGPGVTGTLIDRGIGLPQQLIALGAYCVVASAAMAAAAVAYRRRAVDVEAAAEA